MERGAFRLRSRSGSGPWTVDVTLPSALSSGQTVVVTNPGGQLWPVTDDYAVAADPVRYAACIVLPTTKLDVNKCVRQLLGCKLSFASAEQTVALSDMQIGGVVAIGLPEDVPVYIDDAVFALPEVLMGGGNRSSKLRLGPQELLKMPQAQRVQGLGVLHS